MPNNARGKAPGPRPTPFAHWLTRERTDRGLSQQDLADRAEVSKSRVRQLESGADPTRDMVGRLAAGLSRGQDPRNARRVYDSGMNAAFGSSHELEPLPVALRAVLADHMDDLAELSEEEVQWLADVFRRAIELRLMLKP